MPARQRTAPRAWLTVLRLAFLAEPGLAVQGVQSLARGRKVRGWNQLNIAAAGHPDYYAAWTASTERALLPMAQATPPALIGVVLIGKETGTRDSVIAAFGPDVPIFATVPDTRDRPAWLLPIRAGDRIAPSLGAVLAERLADTDATMIYWDEDVLVGGVRTSPWIKPDWNPLLFAAHDGLTGACVVRGDIVPAGSVDWPSLTRQAGETSDPLHLPLILTHRCSVRTPSVRPTAPVPPVSVSVIIPTRDRAELLKTVLDGLSRTHFPGPCEVIVIDNDSRDAATLDLLDGLQAAGTARILLHSGAFDFATMNNAGVAAAQGDLICLLNNDVEIVDLDWLMRMVPLALDDATGAVGARLLYPDGTIQHAGVAIGIGGAAGHVEKGAVPVPDVFAPWHGETRTVAAVTAACLLIRRDHFLDVGGFDARFLIDFNDVDLCLRLAQRGYRTIYCADATLVHHESKSRGRGHVGADRIRFERETALLQTRWQTQTTRDPYYSPLFRHESERCLLAF